MLFPLKSLTKLALLFHTFRWSTAWLGPFALLLSAQHTEVCIELNPTRSHSSLLSVMGFGVKRGHTYLCKAISSCISSQPKQSPCTLLKKKKKKKKKKSNYRYIYMAQSEASTMEANELFIFKQSLLSLRTHGCNNLFIPPAGKRPLLEKDGEREWQQIGRVVERKDRVEPQRATKCQWVGDKFPTS